MSYLAKLAEIKGLVEAHNKEVGDSQIDYEAFLHKLKKIIGATSESLLAEVSWEDLQECGLPKLLARQAATILREQAKPQLLMEGGQSNLSQKKVDRMSYQELLTAYQPTDANAVSRKLKELSGGQPFIVFTGSVVNVEESTKLLIELRRGFPARDFMVLHDKAVQIYAVGDSIGEMVEENPLYPGRALRPDGTCDQIGRSWEGVPTHIRQLLRVALVDTKELHQGVMTVQSANDILDAALRPDSIVYFTRRFPQASIRIEELAKLGKVPLLKVSLKTATSTGGRQAFTTNGKKV